MIWVLILMSTCHKRWTKYLACNNCIWLCRYDLFRRCVMTIPKRKEQHSGQSKTDIRLEDPSLYQPDPSSDSHWQELQFVSNLPVIKARIGVDSKEHDVQCMIDSGETSASCFASVPFHNPMFRSSQRPSAPAFQHCLVGQKRKCLPA